jgi:hypothetical protein
MPRPLLKSTVAIMIALLCTSQLRAQLKKEVPAATESTRGTGQHFGEPTTIRFQVGAEITARGGACRNIRAMVAVPFECPEQQVRIVEEDFSSEVEQVNYRDVQGGAQQMVITIPFLQANITARAVVTYEVKTSPVLPPDKSLAETLVLPKRLPAEVRRYINPSPYIEARHAKIRSLAREVLAEMPEEAPMWRKIETLYDYVLDHIEYIEQPEDTSALTTLRDEQADCHGRSALFIALCRSQGVPARVVWVNNHAYAEFYLEDPAGHGAWYPVESAGERLFGEMKLTRTILQKGDNFTLPERRGERLRYATDFLTGLPTPGASKPRVKYIREVL